MNLECRLSHNQSGDCEWFISSNKVNFYKLNGPQLTNTMHCLNNEIEISMQILNYEIKFYLFNPLWPSDALRRRQHVV